MPPRPPPPLTPELSKSIRFLNLLQIDNTDSPSDLVRVCEIQPRKINIVEIRGGHHDTPSEQLLGPDIAVLSWRWDLTKTAQTTLQESAEMRSPKLQQFIIKARQRGFKLVWIDWCCIPQHPDGDVASIIIQHIKASRVLYERCTIMLVDFVQVIPGLRIPSIDYMTRLWTTAEMSAALANPNANFNTFVELDQINHITMNVALGASWGIGSSNNTLKDYVLEVKQLTSTQGQFWQKYHYVLRVQNASMRHLYTSGYEILGKKYSTHIADFLRTPQMKPDLIKEKSFLMEEAPISEQEQEKLIQEYWTIYNCDGTTHPQVSALLKEIGTKNEMPSDFSHKKHFVALLLLFSEVFREVVKTHKWNKKCFEEILKSLGEHPTEPKTNPNDSWALRFFMPGDDQVVKKMIFEELGPNVVPITVSGVPSFPRIPIGHELRHEIQITDGVKSFMEFVTRMNIMKESPPSTIMLTMNEMERPLNSNPLKPEQNIYCTLAAVGSDAHITLSFIEGPFIQYQKPSVTVWLGGPLNGPWDRTVNGYALGPTECIFIFSTFRSRTQQRLNVGMLIGMTDDCVSKIAMGIEKILEKMIANRENSELLSKQDIIKMLEGTSEKGGGGDNKGGGLMVLETPGVWLRESRVGFDAGGYWR
jgi:hypothetical protein